MGSGIHGEMERFRVIWKGDDGRFKSHYFDEQAAAARFFRRLQEAGHPNGTVRMDRRRLLVGKWEPVEGALQ